MINNYIRNRTQHYFGFDDRDPEQVALANAKIVEFSGLAGVLANDKNVSGSSNPAVAWRRARGLFADGYVGGED